MADRLEHEPLDAIYVSTLRRTAETAAPLAARRGLEPIVLADLREVHLGEWEGGLVRKHSMEGHPIAPRSPSRSAGTSSRAPSRPTSSGRGSGGRSRKIAERHADQRVAVFTHGAWIGELLSIATGCRPFALSGSDNAVIHQVVVVGDHWIVRRFNDTSHLDGFSVAAQAPT